MLVTTPTLAIVVPSPRGSVSHEPPTTTQGRRHKTYPPWFRVAFAPPPCWVYNILDLPTNHNPPPMAEGSKPPEGTSGSGPYFGDNTNIGEWGYLPPVVPCGAKAPPPCWVYNILDLPTNHNPQPRAEGTKTARRGSVS